MGQRNRLIILGCALLLGLMLPVVRYLNRSDVAHQAIRIWLEHFGSSIYEYHSKTGQWPSETADLAKTSWPQQFRYWKQVLDDETIVVVWHKNLKADPKDNAGRWLITTKVVRPAWSCLGLLGRFANRVLPRQGSRSGFPA